MSHRYPASAALADFKPVLELYNNAEPQADSSEGISVQKHDLIVEILCEGELFTVLNTSLRVLRDKLVWENYRYIPYPGARKLIKGAANFFGDEEKRRMYCGALLTLAFCQSSVSKDRASPIVLSISFVKKDAFNTLRKLAHDVAKYLETKTYFLETLEKI